jgi:putative nucleotidyltransferase with HDIG domain
MSLHVALRAAEIPWSALTAGSSMRIIESLTRTMIARDPQTHQHSRRVQRYAAALAQELAIRDQRTLGALEAAALLHDLGKLGIPDAVLLKPGPLTAAEYEEVKRHPVIGADILSSIAFPGPLALIVRHHHENWDGSGYPDGLRGDEIPLCSRMLAIVDAYDALTSDRPYRRGLSHECALALIRENRGSMYDPSIADVFLAMAARPGHTAASRTPGATTMLLSWPQPVSGV